MARILVVDGAADDRDAVCKCLRAGGHEALEAASGSEGLRLLRATLPSLVITQWGLPDMAGLDLLAGIRASNGAGAAHVLMTFDNTEAEHMARARQAGVDDFMLKPARGIELLARVNAVLGQRQGSDPIRRAGALALDPVSHKVTVGDAEIHLAPVEFRLLAYLMENPGRVFDRQQLLEQVWRRRSGIGERTVDVHIRRLRAALEPHGAEHLLQTVRGFGYRLG
jgi:two-component system phosphate regulon response regulator PhoB